MKHMYLSTIYTTVHMCVVMYICMNVWMDVQEFVERRPKKDLMSMYKRLVERQRKRKSG